MRRHFVADGEWHLFLHYDIISYDTPSIISYEDLPTWRLHYYRDFLCRTVSANHTIGNTQLINMLRTTHGVSTKTLTMNHWRNANTHHMASMADMPLPATRDAFDAMMGAITINDSNPMLIELDPIPDTA